MSQPPQGWAPLPPAPQMPPMPYYGAPPPMQPSKPSGAYKALGIVQMVFGVLGIFYALFSIGSVTLMKSWSATSALYDTTTMVYMLTHAAFAILTGAMLGATGFGVFRAKRWSRLLGIAYACVSLAATVLSTGVNLLVIQPAMYARMHSPIGTQMETFSLVSAVFGVLVASILPIFTLVALARRGAREQLDQ